VRLLLGLVGLIGSAGIEIHYSNSDNFNVVRSAAEHYDTVAALPARIGFARTEVGYVGEFQGKLGVVERAER
jgi:hypothetical protein